MASSSVPCNQSAEVERKTETQAMCFRFFNTLVYPHESRALSYLFASVPFLNSLLYRKILSCIKSAKERGLEGRVNSSSSGTKNIKKEKSNDFSLRFFLAGLRGRGCLEAPPFPSPPPPALGSPPRGSPRPPALLPGSPSARLGALQDGGRQ